MNAMSDRLAMQAKGPTDAPQSPANAQSEHAQPHVWVGVGCVGEWRRGEDRGVRAGVGSHMLVWAAIAQTLT